MTTRATHHRGRRRTSTKVARSSFAGLLGLALAGCADDAGANSGRRGSRYCELLVGTLVDGSVDIDVYTTEGLNDCPADAWDAVNASDVAAETGATVVVLNGPRYWTVDSLSGSTLIDPTVRVLGGIPMRQAGGISFPIAELDAQRQPYVTHTIQRNSRFVFDAGKPVYELVATNGDVFTMQSYSTQNAPQTLDSLATLGSMLTPPAEWTFRTRVLEAPIEAVATTGTATVMQDELGNTYLRTAP